MKTQANPNIANLISMRCTEALAEEEKKYGYDQAQDIHMAADDEEEVQE